MKSWANVLRIAGESEAEQPGPTRSEAYRAYLSSPEWAVVRRMALHAAGGRCAVCNGAESLDVHHRTYERFGSEVLDDLTVLCRTCHDLFHDRQKHRAAGVPHVGAPYDTIDRDREEKSGPRRLEA